MSTTRIINQTKQKVNLKVGNNLVFNDLAVLEVGDTYKVRIDPNATYQEYCMGKDGKGKILILSSDDCIDNKSITIWEQADGSFKLDKVSRSGNVAGPDEEVQQGSDPSGSVRVNKPSIGARMRQYFGLKF